MSMELVKVNELARIRACYGFFFVVVVLIPMLYY